MCIRDRVGLGITQIVTNVGINTTNMAYTSSTTGIHTNAVKFPIGTLNYPLSKTHTIYTDVDHGLNPVTQVSIASSGGGYGTGGGSEEVYYNVQLLNSAELGHPAPPTGAVGLGTTTGAYATAKVTVDKNSGGITDLIIMNGGSAYGIGNTLYVAGIATHSSSVGTGFSAAILSVQKIYNNIGDVVRIAGVTSETYKQYNDLYRISDVHVGAARSFAVVGNSVITGVTTAGIGSVVTANATVYSTGIPIGINTLTYDSTLGIATIGVSTAHGLSVNSKVTVAISTVSGWPNGFHYYNAYGAESSADRLSLIHI